MMEFFHFIYQYFSILINIYLEKTMEETDSELLEWMQVVRRLSRQTFKTPLS